MVFWLLSVMGFDLGRLFEGGVQLFGRYGFLNEIGEADYHVLEGRAVGCGGSLGVCFLEKPELLKGDGGVAAGDFEVKLSS